MDGEDDSYRSLASSQPTQIDRLNGHNHSSPLLAYEMEAMKMQNDEYNAIVERYRRGDHIFKNSARDEREDISLEFNLFIDAAQVYPSFNFHVTFLTCFCRAFLFSVTL